MIRKISTILLLVVISMSEIQSQTTVQAGITMTGTDLVISARPDGALAGNHSGGNVTIIWPTSYAISLGAITSTLGGPWAIQGGVQTSGANSFVDIGWAGGAAAFDWTGGSTSELFRVAVNQTGSGTGTFTITNTVGGGWYFEAGDDKTNTGTPFYQSSVNNVPLPVELSSFTATAAKDLVNLKWTTKTEVNSYGFEIERRPTDEKWKMENGKWQKAGFVKGSGNSNSPIEYSFTDKDINGGKYSYRLKQIDNDGAFEYSAVVEVEVNTAPGEFYLLQNYPNPFNPATTIEYGLAEDATVQIDLFNCIGEKVKTIINQIQNAGVQRLVINAAEFSSGYYILNIRFSNNNNSINKTIKMCVLK